MHASAFVDGMFCGIKWVQPIQPFRIALALSLKPPELWRCIRWFPASLRQRHAQLLAPEGLVSGVSDETIQQAEVKFSN